MWQRIGMQLPYRSIASNLNVSLGTVHNILKLFTNTGYVDPKKQPYRLHMRLLNEQDEIFVIGIVLENPSLYLSEACQAVYDQCAKQVSPATICRIIRKHGLTHKKLHQVAKQRSLFHRGKYLSEVQFYLRDAFVFVDETGCNSKDHTRKFGYSLRGENAIQHRWLHRGTRVSAIAAISSTGLVAVELMTGTVNGDTFYNFVRGSLIPELLPFNGSNPRSIVVLDNCSIHHVREVSAIFQNAGILVLYLPPYSPDLMPIELAFSYIKYYLKDHDDIWQAMHDPKPLIQAAFDSITTMQCNKWITDCGYPN